MKNQSMKSVIMQKSTNTPTDPNDGVSIVICCYNSAERLKPTLEHLCHQVVPSDLKWEVVVVDNASTDATEETARALWSEDAPAALRVVCEEQPGLSHARRRGFAAAQYEFVSFIDDDNWVNQDWVATVFELMTQHPEVGACGGKSSPVFDVRPPSWFAARHRSMAIGEQGKTEGDVTVSRGKLWGAGLTIRKQAWRQIEQAGWKLLLEDRKGKLLTSGGDNELCYWLRFLGWKLYYSPRLDLQHYIPRQRFAWQYHINMECSKATTNITDKIYTQILRDDPQASMGVLRKWLNALAFNLRKSIRYLLKSAGAGWESGNIAWLTFLGLYSQVSALLRMGPRGYERVYSHIRAIQAEANSLTQSK